MKEPITVETVVKRPVERVWELWNGPEHITKWNFASDDWHAPHAENDPRVGGWLKVRMEAKDGSSGFDLAAVYTAVEPNRLVEWDMGGRKVRVEFTPTPDGCRITETFDPEDENPVEFQRAGWQAILENFRKYAESN